MTEGGQRRRLRPATSGNSRFGAQPHGGPEAAIGESQPGTGALVISDPVGQLRAMMTVVEGKGSVRIQNAQEEAVALTEGATGGGLLAIGDKSSEPMVKFGVSQDRFGVVLAGPVSLRWCRAAFYRSYFRGAGGDACGPVAGTAMMKHVQLMLVRVGLCDGGRGGMDDDRLRAQTPAPQYRACARPPRARSASRPCVPMSGRSASMFFRRSAEAPPARRTRQARPMRASRLERPQPSSRVSFGQDDTRVPAPFEVMDRAASVFSVTEDRTPLYSPRATGWCDSVRAAPAVSSGPTLRGLGGVARRRIGSGLEITGDAIRARIGTKTTAITG